MDGRERTVWPEKSTADWAANTSYVFKAAGNYFCLPLPSLPPCLFNNTAAATQQLPSCNSVPQCQVMQCLRPHILFLSISQYIHNSSSGRYNGFRETLDRGNPIMCLPEPNLNHGCRQLNWLVSAEACRNLTKLSAGSETIIIAERKVRCQFPHELHIILINKLRLISQAQALLRGERVPGYAGHDDGRFG